MQRLLKSLKWLDDHILTILVIGFIFIIPLYPKLPFKIVNYTYVAIRLEDYYLALISIIFAIQVFRKKVRLPKTFAILFGLFWLAVFLSFYYGFFIQHTIEIKNVGFLHALRRIEYMIIFFISYTTIKSLKDFNKYLKIIFVVFFVVCVYGFGQKLLGWPAVQTMNPEYAKGYILVLDAYSRISSTFAGHYDLSGYLILLLPIILGYYLYTKNKLYFGLFFVGLSTMILAASRTSYFSYIIAITLFLLYIRKFKLLIIVVLITTILTPLSGTLTKRISRTFQQTKIFVDSETGEVIVPKDLRVDDLPPGDFGTKTTAKSLANATNLAKTQPVQLDAKTVSETKALIRKNIIREATVSGKVITPEEIETMVETTFGRQIPITKNLIDISLSTRFQVEWPRAINAFKKNPILGTGPSSLTEATDGDFFRWFGETGILGTFAFLFILFTIMKEIWLKAKSSSENLGYLYFGILFGFIGLIINATYIDIFEASKVAYTFWLLAGITIGSIRLLKTDRDNISNSKGN